jgi:hypothetical protein
MKNSIQRIIDTRKPKKNVIDFQLQRVIAFEMSIKDVQLSLEQSGGYGDMQKKYCQEILDKIEPLIAKLQRLSDRFGRSHIAIAAFGKTQDGKSTFWKSLTGLDGDGIIPIGANRVADSSCTMVKVSYLNIDTGRESKGIVYYYSKREFVNLINELLKCAEIVGSINNIDEIPDLLYKVQDRYDKANENQKNRIQRLLNFITYYNYYKGNIKDEGMKLGINLNQVGEYARKEINDSENPNYFPVKEIIIETNIHNDFGNIKFIDTRGTGEQAFLIEEQLEDTLRFDSDGGLFIRRYINGFGATIDLHTNICKIINNIKGDEAPWIQFVPNCAMENGVAIDDKSKNNITRFHTESMKNIAIFNPAEDIIDCSKQEDVKNLVTRFVSYLADNIANIDKKLEENIDESFREINKLIQLLQEIKQPNTDSTAKDDVKKGLFEKICAEIGAIAEKYEQKKDEVDIKFKEAYSLDDNTEVDTICPNLETLFKEKAAVYNNLFAYTYCTDILRHKFIDEFVVGANFQERTNLLKKEIVDIFYANKIKLKLELTNKGDNTIVNIEELGIGGALADLLHALSKFTIDINSSFLYILRYCVGPIVSSKYMKEINKLNEFYKGSPLEGIAQSFQSHKSGGNPSGSQNGIIGNLSNTLNVPKGNTLNPKYGSDNRIGSFSTSSSSAADNNNVTYQTIKDNFKMCIASFNTLFKDEYTKSSLILFGFTDNFIDRLRCFKDCEDSFMNFLEDNFDEVFEGTSQMDNIRMAVKQREIYKAIMDIKYLQ